MADIRTGSKFLDQIETAVEQIQMKKDIAANLEVIRKMLNMEFKASCEKVYLTTNETQSHFFGIHVFPSKRELYKIADKVVRIDEKIQFENCSEFIIELDSKLVYHVGATAREITAAILHEIGHKVYSKEAQIRAKVMFMSSTMKYAGIVGGFVKIVSPLKFLLFTAILITFSNSLNSYLKFKDELDADSFAIKYGYGVDLHSLLTKLTRDKGHSMNQASRGQSDEERAIMKWSLRNIMEFSLRRGNIIKELEAQVREEPSEYGKEILAEQLNQIRRSKGGVKLNMSLQKNEDVLMAESMKSFTQLQTKGLSYLELDEISVEIERIESYEDKMYIITRIYRDLSIAQKTIDKLEKKAKGNSLSAVRIEEFKAYVKSLKDLLDKTKSTKVKEKKYGVFLKQPVGDYEEQ